MRPAAGHLRARRTGASGARSRGPPGCRCNGARRPVRNRLLTSGGCTQWSQGDSAGRGAGRPGHSGMRAAGWAGSQLCRCLMKGGEHGYLSYSRRQSFHCLTDHRPKRPGSVRCSHGMSGPGGCCEKVSYADRCCGGINVAPHGACKRQRYPRPIGGRPAAPENNSRSVITGTRGYAHYSPVVRLETVP